MFSFLLFLWGIDKEKRRQVWMGVETYGESRKVVISLSLASKFSKPDTQRIELPYLTCYRYPLSHCCPLRCRICPIFCLGLKGNTS